MQGPADSAVQGAVQNVHACATRLVHEHEGKNKLEQFKFSSPQGLEVICKIKIKQI